MSLKILSNIKKMHLIVNNGTLKKQQIQPDRRILKNMEKNNNSEISQTHNHEQTISGKISLAARKTKWIEELAKQLYATTINRILDQFVLIGFWPTFPYWFLTNAVLLNACLVNPMSITQNSKKGQRSEWQLRYYFTGNKFLLDYLPSFNQRIIAESVNIGEALMKPIWQAYELSKETPNPVLGIGLPSHIAWYPARHLPV